MPGRRGARVEEPERWVFNRLAGAYASRPGYPEALVERLAELAGPGGRVADLGAGAGGLAIPLSARGLQTWAVEPARRMLEALERRAAERGLPLAGSGPSPGGAALHAVHAAAESTGLPAAAFDLAVVADALHWLDPERAGAEIARLLSPAGALAIVEVELLASPFLDALWPRLQAENPKARPRALELRGRRRQLFSLAAPGAKERAETFEADDALSPEAAAAVVSSLSFVGPALSPAAVESLTAWAKGLAGSGGASWRRRLHLRWARRS